jgi:predicted DNA-binding transcriptional regulator AlpA
LSHERNFEATGNTMQILDYDAAAKRIGLVRRSLERLISTGEGPAVIHLGKRRRGIADTDLDAWIRARRHAPPGEAASEPRKVTGAA